MCQSRAAVIRQRPEDRIGINLVACSSEKTGSVVIAQVVSVRSYDATPTKDVGAHDAGLQDRVAEHQLSGIDVDTAVQISPVATDRTVGDGDGVSSAIGNRSAILGGVIPADGAVTHDHDPLIVVFNPAARAERLADGAVPEHGAVTKLDYSLIVDPASGYGGIVTDVAVDDRQHSSISDRAAGLSGNIAAEDAVGDRYGAGGDLDAAADPERHVYARAINLIGSNDGVGNGGRACDGNAAASEADEVPADGAICDGEAGFAGDGSAGAA